jgi:hypothetical protein
MPTLTQELQPVESTVCLVARWARDGNMFDDAVEDVRGWLVVRHSLHWRWGTECCSLITGESQLIIPSI